MKKLKQIIDDKLYSYNPREFMPIYMDGQLANRNAFVAYKIKHLIGVAR